MDNAPKKRKKPCVLCPRPRKKKKPNASLPPVSQSYNAFRLPETNKILTCFINETIYCCEIYKKKWVILGLLGKIAFYRISREWRISQEAEFIHVIQGKEEEPVTNLTLLGSDLFMTIDIELRIYEIDSNGKINSLQLTRLLPTDSIGIGEINCMIPYEHGSRKEVLLGSVKVGGTGAVTVISKGPERYTVKESFETPYAVYSMAPHHKYIYACGGNYLENPNLDRGFISEISRSIADSRASETFYGSGLIESIAISADGNQLYFGGRGVPLQVWIQKWGDWEVHSKYSSENIFPLGFIASSLESKNHLFAFSETSLYELSSVETTLVVESPFIYGCAIDIPFIFLNDTDFIQTYPSVFKSRLLNEPVALAQEEVVLSEGREELNAEKMQEAAEFSNQERKNRRKKKKQKLVASHDDQDIPEKPSEAKNPVTEPVSKENDRIDSAEKEKQNLNELSEKQEMNDFASLLAHSNHEGDKDDIMVADHDILDQSPSNWSPEKEDEVRKKVANIELIEEPTLHGENQVEAPLNMVRRQSISKPMSPERKPNHRRGRKQRDPLAPKPHWFESSSESYSEPETGETLASSPKMRPKRKNSSLSELSLKASSSQEGDDLLVRKAVRQSSKHLVIKYKGNKHTHLCNHQEMYPRPHYGVIVEPFAGSAAYSMRWIHLESVRKVILLEVDPGLTYFWTWLTKEATQEEIRSLPICRHPKEEALPTDLKVNERIDQAGKFKLSRGAEYLIKYNICANNPTTGMGNKVTKVIFNLTEFISRDQIINRSIDEFIYKILR